MRDFHPDDDFASPEEYTPQSSPDDFDPGLPNQLLDYQKKKFLRLSL